MKNNQIWLLLRVLLLSKYELSTLSKKQKENQNQNQTPKHLTGM